MDYALRHEGKPSEEKEKKKKKRRNNFFICLIFTTKLESEFMLCVER
jgi:hypothetical protein